MTEKNAIILDKIYDVPLEPSKRVKKSILKRLPDYTSDEGIIIKTTIVGDSAVGKSGMFERYAENTYTGDQRYSSTIGVDFKVKVSSVTTNRRGHLCKLQMWDTAGQERFRAITQSYYRGTGICIICFDTDTPGGERSIYSMRRWIEDVKWKGGSDRSTLIYIVGMRSDSYGGDLIDLMTQEFKDEVEYINTIENVQFIGFSSSKEDKFVPVIVSNTDDHLTGIISDIQQDTKILTINDMFEIMVIDYIEKMIYTGIVNPNPIKKQQLSVTSIEQSEPVTKTVCCVIL